MTGLGPFWLDPNDDMAPFPDVSLALREPDGLLAVGGNLSVNRLLVAYRSGIFPWYSEGQPILWWSPDPRSVLVPDKLIVSRSLRKDLRKALYTVTLDHDFDAVMRACAQPRRDSNGTWITHDIRRAYHQLHQQGHAHSVETWYQGQLVGGLYGVALGEVFFGESMFCVMPNASKIAFVKLTEQLRAWGYVLIDCQVQSRHLDSLGAEPLDREQFVQILHQHCNQGQAPGSWKTVFNNP